MELELLSLVTLKRKVTAAIRHLCDSDKASVGVYFVVLLVKKKSMD